MKKLDSYIEIEKTNGYNILTVFHPYEIPAVANFEKNCVILNSLYTQEFINDLDENCLIGILYHEIGHLIYFKEHNIDKEEFNEVFKVESEYFAFSYQLKKLMEIAIGGDIDPLKVSLFKLQERITNIKNDKLSKETYSHIEALKILVDSEIYKECLSQITH
jgi:hypothetical protein